MSRINILDSTLRDGAQGESISFSVQDKIRICQALDELGVSYIEAGNPSSNPKDIEFFQEIKKIPLKNSTISLRIFLSITLVCSETFPSI